MLQKLKAVFGSKKESAPVETALDIYQWKYIDYSELDAHPTTIDAIYSGELCGIIIKNFLSPEELIQAQQAIKNIDRSRVLDTGVGFSFPRHFAQLVRPPAGKKVSKAEIQQYFEDCEDLPATFQELLGIDIATRIEKAFRVLSNNRKTEIPVGINNTGKYAFGAIRYNEAGKGFIPIHCGNYFQQEFPSFYEHLQTQAEVKDQLSYFITIQEAEKGGELSLYQLLWENGQYKVNAGDDSGVFLTDGSFLSITSELLLKKQRIKPGSGDLLIFSGGPIWHKVEKVEGHTDRITFGGFLAHTKDDQCIRYWT
jgi:hypothetical protein